MPDENNDGVMLRELGYALGDLQYKYRYSTPLERAELRPILNEALSKYEDYRLMLLGGPTITTESDIAEMRAIRKEIDAAATTQSLLVAMGRIIGFLGTHVA